MESHQLPLIAAAGTRPPGAKGSIGTQSGDGEAPSAPPRFASRPRSYAAVSASVHYRAGAMERPIKFEHSRFVGDKRTQLVYDLDEWDDPAPIESLLAAETGHLLRPRHARRGPQPRLHAGDARQAPPLPPPARLMRAAGGERHLHVQRPHARPPPRRAVGPRRAPPRRDPLPRLPDRPPRRPPLGRHVPPAHRPHRPRPRLRGDDVQLPRHRRPARATSRCRAGSTTCAGRSTT